MTLISRRVKRETLATIFSASKRRPVIVTLEPPSLIGFRLKGTRKTYWLTSDACFMAALKADMRLAQLEKARAKKARKTKR